MKRSIAFLAWLPAVLLAGCTTMNHAQYKVGPPISEFGARAALSAGDVTAIREIIHQVAGQFKLKDMTESSIIPNTFAYFVEIDVAYPMEVKAYTVDDQAYVDVMHTHPYGGELEAYTRLKEMLLSELQRKFGSRLQVTPATTLMRAKPKKAP